MSRAIFLLKNRAEPLPFTSVGIGLLLVPVSRNADVVPSPIALLARLPISSILSCISGALSNARQGCISQKGACVGYLLLGQVKSIRPSTNKAGQPAVSVRVQDMGLDVNIYTSDALLVPALQSLEVGSAYQFPVTVSVSRDGSIGVWPDGRPIPYQRPANPSGSARS